tara:strand:+ start:27 stop:338 length:312 start_codon:yes stop_codon:yes gene_type:complete
MEYILNQAEAEFLLISIRNSKAVPFNIDLERLHTKLKRGIKNDTNDQTRKIEELVSKIEANGYKNSKLSEALAMAKSEISDETKKMRDKYFDSEGNERKRASL